MDPVLIGLLALAWNSSRKKQRETVNGSDSATAFLYQLPQDGYTTTRMAVSTGGDDPRDMGIFDSPAKAMAIAQSNGWTVAHGGQVLQLQTKPGAGA
jgi:hypothetical protein